MQVRTTVAAAWWVKSLPKDLPMPDRVIECLTRSHPGRGRGGRVFFSRQHPTFKGASGIDLNVDELACRVGCGACCIAPSISSPIPGMPQGKPAGVRCVQLTEDNRCRLFG